MAKFLAWLHAKLCSHEFRLTDLDRTGLPEPAKPDYLCSFEACQEYYYGDWHKKRVGWPCAKCGSVFYAHCGLDISPKHGPIIPGSSRKQLGTRAA